MTDTSTAETLDQDYDERIGLPVDPVAVAIVAAEPLHIVEHPTGEITQGSVSLTVAAGAQQLVGAHPWRDTVSIKNQGSAVVYIGGQRDTLTPAGGYPLNTGDELILKTRREVWVMVDPGTDGTNTATVHFLAEHVDA
jgi:hypothetical protein